MCVPPEHAKNRLGANGGHNLPEFIPTGEFKGDPMKCSGLDPLDMCADGLFCDDIYRGKCRKLRENYEDCGGHTGDDVTCKSYKSGGGCREGWSQGARGRYAGVL
jgi:hypothetical protein